MASTSEVGHARNVANFQYIIAFVTSFGPTYQPSNPKLQIPFLQSLHLAATDSIKSVITLLTLYNKAVNDRVEAFRDLRTLSTRLINAFDATDASDLAIADARVFNRKIQGKQTTKKTTSTDPSIPAARTISARQLSYDLRIQHFQNIISILESHPSYTPFEPELQIPTLKTKITNLINHNENEAIAKTALSNARIHRNKILYTNKESIITIAGEVKKYIKSAYGAASPTYGEIKGYRFKLPKK